MIYLVALVIVVALTSSLTRLARIDRITAPWRVKVRAWSGEHGFFTDLLECSRCTSIWTAPVAVFPALALAVAYMHLPWLAAIIIGIPISKAVAYLAYLLLLIEGED